MNCDDAFDAMTDPTLADNTELDWHLDLCPRCRQMREVLAPALDRLIVVADDDAIANPPLERDRSGHDVPFLSAEAVRIAERAAAGSQSRRVAEAKPPARASRRKSGSWVRYAAVALLGATISLSAMGAFSSRKAAAPVSSDGRCTWIHRAEVDTSEPDASRTLVLSCAACHLEGSVR